MAPTEMMTRSGVAAQSTSGEGLLQIVDRQKLLTGEGAKIAGDK